MKKPLLTAMIALSFLTISTTVSATNSYVSIDWLNSYALGNGFETYKHPVLQTCIGHAFENGIEASIWNSLPASFNRIGENNATEVDLNLQYNLGSITLGGSYFSMFPDKNKFFQNDVFQINTEANKVFPIGDASITLGIRIEYDFPVNGHYDKQTTGLYIIPKINFNYRMSDQWKASLNTKFTGDLGGYGAEKALVINIASRVTHKISEEISFNAGIDMYFPAIKTNGDIRRDMYIPRIGMSYAF